MARRKNIQRRNTILRNTFVLIKKNGIDKVSLQMIADAAEISKSLLQSYYPHKQRLINDIVQQFLTRTLQVTLKLMGDEQNPFVATDVFVAMVLNLAERDPEYGRVLDTLFSDFSAIYKWAQVLSEWLEENELLQNFGDPKKAKIGLAFSIAGCANLFMQRSELGITPQQISDIMIVSFLSTFGDDKQATAHDYLAASHKIIADVDMAEVQKAADDLFLANS